MAGVNVPTTNDPLKTVVPMAGAAVGGMYGGPAGAMAGKRLGQDITQGGPDPSAVQTKTDQQPPDALMRRLQAQNYQGGQ